MAKRILGIAVALIVAGFLYLGYHNYDAGKAAVSGDVTSGDSSYSRSSTIVPRSSEDADTRPSPPAVYPAPTQSATATEQAAQSGQTARPGTTYSGTSTPPATDTISPNPTNGMVFSGTGHFQLYRQGNLTWRLNTDTGQSCILFATDEEWKKPRVYKAGCGKS